MERKMIDGAIDDAIDDAIDHGRNNYRNGSAMRRFQDKANL